MGERPCRPGRRARRGRRRRGPERRRRPDREDRGGDLTRLVEDTARAYLARRRVMLRLTSKATYPSDLNSLEGSCPCPGSWSRAYGAHLVTRSRGLNRPSRLSRRRHLSPSISAEAAGRDRQSRSCAPPCGACAQAGGRRQSLRRRAAGGAVGAMLDALLAPSRDFAPERPFTVALYGAQARRSTPRPLPAPCMVHGLSWPCRWWSARRAAGLPPMEPGEPLELDAAGMPAPLDLARRRHARPGHRAAAGLRRRRRAAGPGRRLLRPHAGGPARRRQHPAHCAVGLAYAGQEVDDLPMEPHDQRLDGS